MIRLTDIPGYLDDEGVTEYKLDDIIGAYRIKKGVYEMFDFYKVTWRKSDIAEIEFLQPTGSHYASKEEVFLHIQDKLINNFGGF